MRFNSEDTRRFLHHVMPPGTVLEMRVFRAQWGRGNYIEPGQRFSSTFSGYYDNHDAVIVDAGRLSGVSGFITFNPVRRDLLARSANKLSKAKSATVDDDIASLRWAFIDIDPIRPADISATNEELGLALAVRNQVFLDYPGIKDHSLSGCSGNGYWILVKIGDLTNTAASRAKVARMLDALAARYSDDRIHIDVKTKNPARVMCLPGTLKTKGSSIPERPHRLATIDHE